MKLNPTAFDYAIVVAQATPDKQLAPRRILCNIDDAGEVHRILLDEGYTFVTFDTINLCLVVEDND
ncbi:hypothetical protein [Microvirus mar61]|uniref:Uncharacterized protein n=1 Tax=Microvirus mar61 TaxID=2851198 RepID=A0A8F5MLS8_9VIRU|nr:hypothetical protein [Microvirus mar61]